MLFVEIPIVVTASRKEQYITEAPSNITVITSEEIRQSGARTIGDILKRIPGIEINMHRKGLGRIWIRAVTGRYNDKILFMIDGYPWRELVYGQFPVDEQLPLAHIKRVEVIKGPGSSLYGTNAFAGVINVITKDASDIDGCEMEGGVGNWDTQSHHLLCGKEKKSAGFVFFANYYNSEGDKHERDRKGESTDRRDPKKQIELNLKGYWGDFTFGVKHLWYDWEYLMYPDSRDRYDDWENSFFHIGYSKSLSDQLHLMVSSYYNLFDHNTEKRKRKNDSLTKVADRQERTDVFGAGIQVDYNPFKNHFITAGIEYEREMADKLLETYYKTDDPDQEEQTARWAEPARPHNSNWGLYLEDTYKILPWINIVAGVRYDKHEEYGGALSPRGAIILKPAENLVTKILYGQAFRAPSYREMYIREDNDENNGNRNLDPEYIRTAELNVSYAPMKQMKLDVSLFFQEIDDAIGSRETEDGSMYDNLGEIDIHGIEPGIEVELFNKKLTAFANYTYYFKAEDDNGDNLPNIARQMANVGLNIKTGKYLTINTTLSYVGRRNKPDDYQGQVDDADRKDNLGGYERVDLVLTGRNLPVDISLGVYNIFNVQSFNPSYEPGSYYDIEHPGRSALLKVAYTF